MLWHVKAKPARLLPAKFVQPCLGVDSDKVPTGEGWIHEIKHDGYRMQVRKDGDRVRLFTRRGFDWTDRDPRIVAAALKGAIIHDGWGDGLSRQQRPCQLRQAAFPVL